MAAWRALTTAAALALLAPAGRAADDPLAPARAGKLQCAVPHTERKTCLGLAQFKFENDTIVDISEFAIDDDPLVVARTTGTETIKGTRVCGIVREEDARQATFTRDGKPLTGADAEAAQQTMYDLLAPQIGHDYCVDFAPYNDRLFVVQSYSDGVQLPRETYYMIWVSPDEGYTVGY